MSEREESWSLPNMASSNEKTRSEAWVAFLHRPSSDVVCGRVCVCGACAERASNLSAEQNEEQRQQNEEQRH